ncbi:hypothetical protein QN388_25245, partial [Pseudomonas sp. 5B4]
YLGYAPWLYAPCALTVVGCVTAPLLARRDGAAKDWAIVVLAASGFLAGQVAFLGHDPWGRYIAGTAHLPALQAELRDPTTPIYA